MEKMNMIFLNCDLLIPESGIGCHSGGGVPLETPSDEVGEQRVLAPCNILRTNIVPRTHFFLSFVYCHDYPDDGFTFEGSL